MTKDIGKAVLEKIENERVKPYSRWHFLYTRSVIWSLFLISVLLGSIATGIAVFQLKNAEWDMYQHFNHSIMEFVFLVLPYFWIIFMILFSIFSYYYFLRTETGYKYSSMMIISGSVFASLLFGVLLSQTILPEKLHHFFESNIAFYRHMEAHRHKVWMNPSDGFLAGTIREMTGKEKMVLEDLNGRVWTVDILSADFRGRTVPEKNIKIKIIGEMTGDHAFFAREIRPWQGRGHMKGRGHHGRHRMGIPQEK